MEIENLKSVLNDIFKASQNTYRAKDDARLSIAFNKSKCEETLNEMWSIYGSGNIQQLIEYQKQVQTIKDLGCKVLRNSSGKHKIVI